MQDPVTHAVPPRVGDRSDHWFAVGCRWLGARTAGIDWWAVDRSARRHLIPFSIVMFLCLFLVMHVDEAVVLYFRELDAGSRHVIGTISDIGKSTWWLLIGTACFLYFRYVYGWRLMASRAMFLVTAVALSGLLTNLLKFLFGRARPKVMFRDEPYYGFTPGALDGAFHSFPSGHTTTATAVAVAALFIWPRMWPLWLAFVLLIGFTRVALNAHFPSDIVAALYVGTMFVFIWGRFWERRFGPLTPVQPATPRPIATFFRWMKRPVADR